VHHHFNMLALGSQYSRYATNKPERLLATEINMSRIRSCISRSRAMERVARQLSSSVAQHMFLKPVYILHMIIVYQMQTIVVVPDVPPQFVDLPQ
jgi:hypothetical protein